MEKNSMNCKINRIVTLSLIFLLSIAILAGCGGNNSSSNNTTEGVDNSLTGELVVTSFGGTYDEVFTKYIKEPFEEEYPGVTVTLAPYAGLAKLEQGGGAGIDVVQLDDFDLIDAANKGLLLPLEKDQFTSWSVLYPQAILEGNDNQVYGLVNVFGSWGIAYNTEKVEKPESWNDFLKPELSGKVAMMSQWIPDIIMLGEAVGANTENMEPAWQAFENLAPSITQFYPSFSTPEALFQTGEVNMASWFDGRVYALQASGVPVDFTIPKEGGVLIRSGLGVMADSDKAELARALIDFAMSPEAQVGFAEELFYGPTNTGVYLEGDIEYKLVYGKEKVEQLIIPNWKEILPKREEWLTKWTEATTR